MKDLRVYVGAAAARASERPAVFYSRRADGPYYRWLYEQAHGRWRFSRVSLSGLNLRVLRLTSWDAVPNSLQASIGEHYLE